MHKEFQPIRKRQKKKHTNDDVRNARELSKQSKHAFCHFRCLNQSHSCIYSNSSLHNSSILNSNSISNSQSQSKVLVCTRNNPNVNTFDNTIHKRSRTKNMSTQTPLQENPNVSNQPPQRVCSKSITIATQTDKPSN